MNTRTLFLLILATTLLLVGCNAPIYKVLQLPTAVPENLSPKAKLDNELLFILNSVPADSHIDLEVHLFEPLNAAQREQLTALMTVLPAEDGDVAAIVMGSAEIANILLIAKLDFVHTIQK